MTSTDATRAEFQTSFVRCSRCAAALRDHTYADLAVAPAGSPEHDALVSVIEDEAWDRLPAVSRDATSPLETSVTFRALRCPSGGGTIVPLLLAHTVLGDDHLAGTVYEISENDLEGLPQQCKTTWHPYSDSWVVRSHE